MRRALQLLPLTALALAALTGPAAAQSPAAAPTATPARTANEAVAQDLFDQGMKLMGEGKFADGCAKLEASNKAAWAPGTTINLADCYEQIGRLASAWAKFLECEPHFRNRNPPDPRADIAKSRAESLYSKLSRLNITVPPEARVAGLVIKRDGDPVDESQWGTGLPVDPGKHTVEASAPGKKPWKWEAEVGAGGTTVSVSVAVLEADSAAVPAPSTSADSGAMPVQKKIAIAAGAAGVVSLAVGGIFGGLTLGKVAEADKSCTKVGDVFQCDKAGAAARTEASGLSMVSTVGFIAGGVLAAGGVVLWLTAPAPISYSRPSGTGRSLWIAPAIANDSAGVTAGGRF